MCKLTFLCESDNTNTHYGPIFMPQFIQKYYKNNGSHRIKSCWIVSNNNAARCLTTSQEIHLLFTEWCNLCNLVKHTK